MSGGPLSPSRQVVFHQMLVAARRSVLNDALSEVLGQIDPDITKKQILAYVPSDAQRILAAAGIRDEHIFPVPAVLERRPTLIKQHLRIKAFYGTSENAVKTQIWIAVSVYVLVAIVRKQLALDATLYQILQALSVTLFEKTPILQAFQDAASQDDLPVDNNQLILFDF